jgi:hypothetical protein
VAQTAQLPTRIISNESKTEGSKSLAGTSRMIVNDNSSWDLLGEEEYDVTSPNDYIKYCEERLQQRKSETIAKENKRLIAEQENFRNRVEKDRREAAMKGDYSHFMAGGNVAGNNAPLLPPPSSSSAMMMESMMPPAQTAGVGRGRGRGGLTNLPAWMTALNSQATSGGDGPPGSQPPPSHHPDQFSDMAPPNIGSSSMNPPSVEYAVPTIGVKRTKGLFSKPSCIVLLKNMVGPNEVDNVLADETKQECLKYGPVSTCVVFEVEEQIGDKLTPDHERVRTFVAFERQESAVKAYRDLNGRFFGGRQITASFYDESKFDRLELAPGEKEW